MFHLIQFILLFNLQISLTENYNFERIAQYPVVTDFFDVDAMGNIYTINTNVITKYSSDFKKSCSYFNSLYGVVSSIDVSDPFKIVVFYKDFNQVVWLDNTLTEIQNSLKLDNIGLNNIELVCNSAKNGLWILNTDAFKIQYLTNTFQITNQSIDLNTILSGKYTPVFLSEKNLRLFLQIPEKGILLFDQFANFISIIPLKTNQKIGISEEQIYYAESDSLMVYNTITSQSNKFSLPLHTDIKQIIIKKNMLYIFSDNLLSIYEIKL